MLFKSDCQTLKAEPMPPNPNIRPKNTPATIPTLSGFKSVAKTTIAEKADAMTSPVMMDMTIVQNRFR